MRLTTKGRYAVTAMLDLSLNYGVRPITLADISDRQGISLSYLEQLFANLRRQGLVSSSRGPGGGYRLSRSADEVTVLDVISAVDEKVDATRCEGKGNCSSNGEQCLSHEIWQSLSEQIRSYLGGITLGQVVKDHKVNNAASDKVIKFEMMG
jgi:Rrf2 family iron-sulfur cluster assembly transcriptional regulator